MTAFAISASLDALAWCLSENSFFKLGGPTNLCPLGYLSDLLLVFHQMAQPLSKAFHPQKTLGFKITPDRSGIDSCFNEFTILFLGDGPTLPEMA